jgi:type IV secretory pathway TrbD component
MTFNEFIPYAFWTGGIAGILVVLSSISYIWLEWVFDGELDDGNILKHMWGGDDDCFAMSLFCGVLILVAGVVAAAMVFVAVKFYAVTLSILLLMLISYLARMAIRHRKLFDKHVVDKEAHSK